MSTTTRPVTRVVTVIAWTLIVAAAAGLIAGCSPRVRIDPIEVKQIHIVHDINIRVDRHLDEFFAFQDQPAATQAPTTATTRTTVGDAR